ANACGDPATTQVITGPIASGTSCATWATGALTNYGRRCHFLTGLTPGDTIKFRWRFISDPSAEFAGFYLDDIAVTNILLPNACSSVQAPAALSAESLLTHANGTFGLPLPLNGRGIESRRGTGSGAARDYLVVLHFDRPVNGGSATVSGMATAGPVSFSGNDMIVPLTGVTNQQTVTVTANNVTTPDGGNLDALSVQIGFLIGDVNGDGFVSGGDTIVVRNNSGNATSATNFKSDVNLDGIVNGGDTLIVRGASGNSL
ncbi:MAG: dockerin type I domain-containing protein, partial [Chthoniobacterales bacterium]